MVVSGEPAENVGAFVTVRRVNALATELTSRVMWEYDGFLLAPYGERARCVADDCLQPIRPPREPEAVPVAQPAEVAWG